jgi:signal transduction histidine kinase
MTQTQQDDVELLRTRLDELEFRLSRKTKEVEIIQFIAREIISTLDLDQILASILISMKEVLGFEYSMILLLDEAGEKLQVVASRGYEESGIDAEAPVGQGIIGVVARRKKMMRVNHIGIQKTYIAAVKTSMQESATLEGEREAVRLPGLEKAQSQIALPLLVKDRLIGVLAVESPVLNAFDELDETLLLILGNQTASAIENGRLYRVAEERLKELNQANDALAQLNESLEEKVEQRTTELSNTLRQLTETQNQLVLQEKMASLGHLVSGLAHEINNPIGVVNSAVDVAQRCIAKIESSADLQSNEQSKKPLRLLKDNIAAVLVAGERIDTLVKSLKGFAHLDEAEFQVVDLRVGLDDTLTLIQADLRGRIEVVKEYGEIPPLYCSPAQINQVFMSLLLNAVQATEGPGTIHLVTLVEDGRIHVRIADSGKGIAAEKLEHLFDFGFSSDRTRVKMGAGLSTSYSIVQQHKGEIRVESTVGAGSSFTVVLPLQEG